MNINFWDILFSKVVLCGSTLVETLQIASAKLGEVVVQLRSQAGAVIDDLAVLR